MRLFFAELKQPCMLALLLLLSVFPGQLSCKGPRDQAIQGSKPTPMVFGELDLSSAVIVSKANNSPSETKAIEVLQEEIEKRTGIELDISHQWPTGSRSVIAVGQTAQIDQLCGPYTPECRDVENPGSEGFALLTRSDPQGAALILGRDSRGVLYGVGEFLRKSELRQGSILLPSGMTTVTSPKYGLRGHQLGYRPKTNAYDAWTPAQYDQYIRELALFGTNSIEIVPPRTDDDFLSRHMKTPPLEMMMRLSEIIDSYGLDVWIWYPNMGDDYVSEEGIKKELAERSEIFSKLKRIDHILVPGGDPGDLHPDEFFPFMDRMAAVLQEHHPEARIWPSPQAFEPTREWLTSFYAYVNRKPSWLGGVCFAPWIKTPIEKMRRIVSADIKIRRYPDITHNVASQYPVRDWDRAFALTLHRESYNPRPQAMKAIHNAFDQLASGSLTYSEGINDDINKFVWGDQDWDPTRDYMTTLRDYVRLYIGPDYADEIAQAFLAQEKNWEGPLASNNQVGITLQTWRTLEGKVSDKVLGNYRFQMGLMRAYYDAYVQQRLLNETGLEMEAMASLSTAPKIGSRQAIKEARRHLDRAKVKPVGVDLKRKCEFLADELYRKIGSQLYVGKHGAKYRTRGAFMDGIDVPLNNVAYLKAQFKNVLVLGSEPERIEAISRIMNRTNPGPGGFYDDMGSPPSLKRVHYPVKWEEDPGALASPQIFFEYRIDKAEEAAFPLAWKNRVATIYETPLTLVYEDLDRNAQYRVRAIYTGRLGTEVRLVADDTHIVHELVAAPDLPSKGVDIPREATADGRLKLTWNCGEGQPGVAVAEIFLIKN
jgi:hypothetical protein